MKSNYIKKIDMICPFCKRKIFEYDNKIQNSIITCASCKKHFTKKELLNSNNRNIENNFKKLGEDAMKDLAKDIKKIFGNSKYFKIKI